MEADHRQRGAGWLSQDVPQIDGFHTKDTETTKTVKGCDYIIVDITGVAVWSKDTKQLDGLLSYDVEA